jgi:hypothetical protein
LTALNVPGGPALLLQLPDGQTWLVNGSSQADALADGLGRRLSPLDDHLDGLILTEKSAAVQAGLSTLVESYPPRLAGLGASLPESAALRRLNAALKSGGTQVRRLETGAVFDLASGAQLNILADTPAGTALWLEWQGFRCLLPGGVPLADLPRSLPTGVSLLLLGPADLQHAPPEEWADLFQPQSLLTTAGAPAGLPGEISLTAYQAVVYTTSGSQLWVEGIKK